MDSSQLPSLSTESTGPMTVAQHRSDQQQSLAVFDQFDLLPAEMRAKIWSEALDEEAKTRFLLYDDSYGVVGDSFVPSIADKGVFFPHKKLRSSLLEVNRESRWIGLKFYHLELKVYPRAPRFMDHLLPFRFPDPPESWIAPSHGNATPLGVVHIRPEQDTVLCHTTFNDFSYPQVGDVKCVTANLSAKAREDFRQVWSGFSEPVNEKIFTSLCSDLSKNFPSNEGIVRFEFRGFDQFRDREVMSRVMDRILARGFQDVRQHYDPYIRVYDKDGQEKGAEDEHQESLDEDTEDTEY
ncbi:SAS complex subunit [Pestalotiopsis sp. IQ-011]